MQIINTQSGRLLIEQPHIFEIDRMSGQDLLRLARKEHAVVNQGHHVFIGNNFVECLEHGCEFHAHDTGSGYLVEHGRPDSPIHKLVSIGGVIVRIADLRPASAVAALAPAEAAE